MKVIFFDGVCATCNTFVDLIIKLDKEKKFQFSPLQSEFAKSKVPESFTKDLNTIVYLAENNLHTKSEAICMILGEIKGFVIISKLMKCFPVFFLNWFYDHFANNRYKFFGKKESCRIPTADERSRFIN